MSESHCYHNRKKHVCMQICSLLISLTTHPLEYDDISLKIEYWIKYVLHKEFLTVEELVEGVLYVVWNTNSWSFVGIGKFLKEFYDAPHYSEQARTFVAQMYFHVLRWFVIVSVEDVSHNNLGSGWLTSGERLGFICAASFVRYLIKWELLSHEPVQRHLIKPLTNHYENSCRVQSYPGAVQAGTISKSWKVCYYLWSERQWYLPTLWFKLGVCPHWFVHKLHGLCGSFHKSLLGFCGLKKPVDMGWCQGHSTLSSQCCWAGGVFHTTTWTTLILPKGSCLGAESRWEMRGEK